MSKESNEVTFEILFEKALAACKAVYEKHRPQKGDSWRTSEYEFLIKKFVEEFQEWEQIPGNCLADKTRTRNFPLIQSKYENYQQDIDFARRYNIEELIDIVNVALMMIERLLKAS